MNISNSLGNKQTNKQKEQQQQKKHKQGLDSPIHPWDTPEEILRKLAFLTDKHNKPMNDLSSRSNIKSVLAFMVVIWYTGSEISILKVHIASMVNGVQSSQLVWLLVVRVIWDPNLQRRSPSFKVFHALGWWPQTSNMYPGAAQQARGMVHGNSV